MASSEDSTAADAHREQTLAHVVVLPFAQQGHINPLMQLSKKLVTHGCIITFVLSENTVPKKPPSTSRNIHYAGIPDCLPPERSRGSDIGASVESMVNMEKGFVDLLHRLHILKELPVSCIIADAFMLWSQSAAAKFAIPCICFFTCNIHVCALAVKVPDLIRDGLIPFARDEKGVIVDGDKRVQCIPGVPPVAPLDFPMCLTFEATHFRFRLLSEVCKVVQKAPAIIVNSFEELEPEPLAALQAQKAVYAVGPLLLMSGTSKLDVDYWAEDERCVAWLDRQSRATVLYVSLGSVASLPAHHFKELALGLEASGHPFLWVVRPDSVQDQPWEEALPPGFVERTKGRGLIISWAPQLLVLGHPSLGGFLTHCGWNSIIENLSTGGVPMICWPHGAEQRLNRLLLTEQWRIGLGLKQEPDGMVAKEEVARVVSLAMTPTVESQAMRAVAQKAQQMAKEATGRDGSSENSFRALVAELVSR